MSTHNESPTEKLEDPEAMDTEETDSRDEAKEQLSQDRAERQARLQEFANRGGTIDIEDYRRKSRRAFLGFGALGIGGFLGFKRLQARPEDDNIPDFLRTGLEWNEKVWDIVGSDSAEARTYEISDREGIRVNGTIGMRTPAREFQEINLDIWSLRVLGPDGRPLETLDMAPIQALPQQDLVWLHKCVEGWSNVVHWTGARFSDFEKRYADDLPPYKYVALRTPDSQYFVGLTKEDMLNDQTLLAWGLNGEPLSQRHGAPLRLATPNKYGIKQLKRIGTIEFTNERPPDYWAARGYDWDAGF